MTDTGSNQEETWNPPIEATKSVPTDIPSADPTYVHMDSVQVVEGEMVKMHQAAAFSVLADDVDMRESAGFIIRADEIRVDRSVTFLMAAGEVKGNVTTLFTPVTAAIVGAALLVGMWLIRPRK